MMGRGGAGPRHGPVQEPYEREQIFNEAELRSEKTVLKRH